MKKRTGAALCLGLLATGTVAGAAVPKGEAVDAKKMFEQHCAACHPNGGNVMNPAKTLGNKELKANGVKSAKDIVAKMRKPGPGMTTFDKKTVPDTQAKAIAEYILKTFK